MHFSWLTSFGVYAAYASFAAAAPGTPARAQPCPDNCKPEDVVIAGLKSQYKALATSFCSSCMRTNAESQAFAMADNVRFASAIRNDSYADS